jgi:hypothetical protein
MSSESIPFHTNSFEDDIDSQNLDFRLIFPWFSPTEENGIMPYNDPEESEHEKEEPSINPSHNSNSSINTTDFVNKKFVNKKRETNKKRKAPHNRLSSDNLLRKIQVHYFTFIISFLNFLLKYFKYDYKFLKLDYSIKKNINKNANKRKSKIGNEKKRIINSFDDDTVEKIISQNISNQYKRYEKNQNQLICEAVKENKTLYNILKENHINIFKKFYFTSCKLINLREYGLDQCIKLPNDVKTHIDLLKQNEAFGEEYKKSINECILKNFFPKAKFLFY